MQHTSLREVHRLADVQLERPQCEPHSRTQRLERWAEVLLEHGDELLATLEGTEYRRPSSRAIMRRDKSPISIAFSDPVLRSAGLRHDTYGEAKKFFELSDNELHYVVCHCHFGARMSGRVAAERVRSLVPTTSWLRNLGSAIRRWLA